MYTHNILQNDFFWYLKLKYIKIWMYLKIQYCNNNNIIIVIILEFPLLLFFTDDFAQKSLAKYEFRRF